MPYRLLADAVVILHLGFVAFVLLGGLLVLRWPRFAWAHAPAAAWGAFVEFSGWICPLTPLERWLRARDAGSEYQDDFVGQYVLPALYPDWLTRPTQFVLGAMVVILNLAIYGWLLARRRRRDRGSDALLVRLTERFDVDVSGLARRASLAMRVAALVGGLCITAAAVLFFVRIWGRLSTPVQVALLVLAPLAALGATEASTRRPSWRLATPLLATAAFGAFVLDVEGLGRIFGLIPAPEALLAYGLFAAGLAYAFDHRLLLATSAVCLSGWIMATLVRLTGAWWTSALERPEGALLAGTVLAAWAQLPHRLRDRFPQILRAVATLVVLLAVFLLSRAGSLSWLPANAAAIATAYQILSFPLAVAVILVGLRRGYGEVFVLGTIGLLLFLLTKFVDWWWDWMPRYLFFLVVGTLAIAVLRVAAGMRRRLSQP